MPPRPRSLKRQMDVLTAQMREHGATWSQIAADYQLRFKLNPLRGFREAHRYTQSKVVQLWNLRWPDDALSERRLGAWEAWPSVTGNEPPISGLERLARIYQCRAGDLVHGEDHSRDDDRAGRHPVAKDGPAPGPYSPSPISPHSWAGYRHGRPATRPVGFSRSRICGSRSSAIWSPLSPSGRTG